MNDVPDAPSPQSRTEATARITARVRQGWPHLGEPVVTYRGQFCYRSRCSSRHEGRNDWLLHPRSGFWLTSPLAAVEMLRLN